MTASAHAPFFIKDSAQFHETVLSLIRSAKREIALETYIFEYDKFSREILRALIAAHRRGVAVRMIIDGYGSHRILRRKYRTLQSLPFGIRIYHPMPWHFSVKTGWRQRLRMYWDAILKVNNRDHRKVLVVDNEVAIIGSHNMWDCSLDWEEASQMIIGKAAEEVHRSFNLVWRRSYHLTGPASYQETKVVPVEPVAEAHEAQVLDNITFKHRRKRERMLMAAIQSARERIWITTPYLCPHHSFLRAIKRKARAGVDVRLILPHASDVHLLKWVAQSMYADLLQHDIKIYEFTKDILHAKVTVLDDRYFLGSSNMNHRSFFQDFEIDVFSADEKMLQEIVAWKTANMNASMRIRSTEQVDYLLCKSVLVFLLHPFKAFF